LTARLNKPERRISVVVEDYSGTTYRFCVQNPQKNWEKLKDLNSNDILLISNLGSLVVEDSRVSVHDYFVGGINATKEEVLILSCRFLVKFSTFKGSS